MCCHVRCDDASGSRDKDVRDARALRTASAVQMNNMGHVYLKGRVLAQLFDVSEVVAGVHGLGAHFFFNTEQLVVLGEAFRAARSTSLDLAGAQTNSQVGNERVFRFTTAVGRHDAPARLLRHGDSFNRFPNRPDLVDLEQQGIARLFFNRLLDAGGIGHGQVVTNNLDMAADRAGELLPRSPVILVKGVFNRHNGAVVLALLNERLVHTDQSIGRDLVRLGGIFVLEVQVVASIFFASVEFRRSNVHANLHLVGVASQLDGFLDQAKGFSVFLNVGRETTFVTDGGGVQAVALVNDFLQGVVHFRSDLHGFSEAGGTSGQDHEFLHGQLVAGMGTTVDDVERRHREARSGVAGQVSNVLPEGYALGRGTGLAHGKRDSQDGVSTELLLAPAPFVLRAIKGFHHVHVEFLLVLFVLTDEGRRNDRVHVVHGLGHTLAEVGLASVAEFQRFKLTRGRTRRHGGAEETVFSDKVNFHSGVAAGVEDLARFDGLDRHPLLWRGSSLGANSRMTGMGLPSRGILLYLSTWRQRTPT
ncbi:hypothetical protein H310_02889 [Aphanomyces invadans]|uniref:Uncharacterized protein n=1 Tax=Aphanomyces invadans TaxID=157072 RepID=A0A024UJT0_9STRA|nr:hypothetical protein H310_02889 [Aphanomyces invadans]ETW06711.1 hypothetical protein H310_02889 [Aphanomyces invadans]|eukprot:XP_008864786.1 hypothetical protein H310_02889 [Aphanomyces invadans]